MPMSDNYGMKGDEMDLVATHQRLLIAGAMRTTGAILELGVGWYSTPLLHEIAKAQKRLLITMDNNEHWIVQFRSLSSTYHRFVTVGWWGEMFHRLQDMDDGGLSIGLVMVDQGQPIEREYAIRGLLDLCPKAVFVMHDTEEGFAYGYERTLPMFKHKWTDRCHRVWTTIASNGDDVTKWGLIELPPVEPSTEVT